MAWHYKIHQDLKIVEIDARGRISKSEMLGSINIIEQAWAEHEISMVLVDARDVELMPGTLDLMDFGSGLPQTKIPRSTRYALVINEAAKEDMRFLETVTRNRGMQVALFDNVEDAIAWLKS